MKAALRIIHGLASLFFDDASLALVVLFILAVAANLANAAWVDVNVTSAFLVAGVVAALVENVLRTARRARV
jgi:hypothetical protein